MGDGMKTSDLIAALSADPFFDGGSFRRLLYGSALAGALVTAGVFLLSLGWRPDIGTAIGTIRFPFKFVITLAVVLSAAPLLVRMASPLEGQTLPRAALSVGPLLMLLAVVLELVALPANRWWASLVGSNALLCLASIPALSLPSAAALMLAMKRGAPARPGLAGAVCGLVAAGIAATFYALHCDDDSPLFVAVWYTLAVAIVTFVSARVGGRMLRW
jgi:hypothetical protein